MEAISASDSESAEAPMPVRIAPYTIDAGPPFNRENWKIEANVSHGTSMSMSKLIDDGKLMNR
jgi:hypothetical protein